MFAIRNAEGLYWDGGMFRPSIERARLFTTPAQARSHAKDDLPREAFDPEKHSINNLPGRMPFEVEETAS